MPWEPPMITAKAYEEFRRKMEKLPDILPEVHFDPPMTYYNNKKSCHRSVQLYDLFYNFKEDYDPKLARDDGISLGPIFEGIFKEEEHKTVPVTSQMWYGRPWLHKKVLDWSGRLTKVSGIKDFYRAQGINISTELEKQPEH